jgi:hypothetical protein
MGWAELAMVRAALGHRRTAFTQFRSRCLLWLNWEHKHDMLNDPTSSVRGCSKRNGCSMVHGGGAPRSRPNSAVRGSISSGARPRRGIARYQSLWALRNGGSKARMPRAMAPAAHYNHGEQFSHAQREEGRGNKLGEVPPKRVVLEGHAGMGDRRCIGGILAAQARLDGACTWEFSCARG